MGEVSASGQCLAYYTNIVDVLLNKQREIRDDKQGFLGTKTNTKGYSRLYDMTDSLLIEIMKTAMKDSLLSTKDQDMLWDKFVNKIVIDMNAFRVALPSLNYSESTTSLFYTAGNRQKILQHDSLQTLNNMASLDKSTVPKHLHYQLDVRKRYAELFQTKESAMLQPSQLGA